MQTARQTNSPGRLHLGTCAHHNINTQQYNPKPHVPTLRKPRNVFRESP